jgi:hypothetical protein
MALPKKPWALQASPRLHFCIDFRTYCRRRISSSPPRLRRLSVTESVALPPDPWERITCRNVISLA